MKTVILTGSTGGLGKCLASQIYELSNIELICVYRNEAKFKQYVSENKLECKRYKTNPEDDYSTICEQISKESDEIILILNAFSIVPVKAVGTLDAEEINSMIDGNIKQTVRILNTVVHYCKSNDLGLRIINLDSGAADFPLKGWGNYCASKAYVNAFLSVTDLENPSYKVVSIDPGVMDTSMQEVIRETPSDIFDKVDDFIAYKANGVLRKPAEAAEFIISQYVQDWKAVKFREKISL